MEATCVRIEVDQATVKKTPIGKLIDIRLHAMLDNQPIVINLAQQLRPLIGMLRPNRRQAIVDTMPPTITIEAKRSRGKESYFIADHEIRFWAEQINNRLSAYNPLLRPTVP